MILKRDFWIKRIASLNFISLFICIGLICSHAAERCFAVELLAEYSLPDRILLSNPISPDGKKFVTYGLDYQGLFLHDIQTGKIQQTFEPNSTVFDPSTSVLRHAFSPDGSKILYSTIETLLLKNVDTGELIKDYNLGVASAFCFSKDGKTFLTGHTSSSEVVLIDTATGDTLKTFPEITPFPLYIAIAPDENSFLDVALNQCAFVDISTGEILSTVVDELMINAAYITPDFTTLALLMGDYTIRIWKIRFDGGIPNASHFASLESQKDYQFPTISQNGKYIITGRSGNTGADFIEIETGNIIKSLPHNCRVPLAAFTPDGKKALTYSLDDFAYKLWDVSDISLTDIHDWPRHE